ncbi:amidohydrolase [Methylobacillus methanolivorans]|uniref:Amidohydrolase n=1 Tax=Methylobacillus methanolivorans TaxID=1848927 RepID=A0ABW8GK95_9PROT
MKHSISSALLTLLLLAGCTPKPPMQSADTLYFGGPILTMEGETPQYAETISVKDGKILFVGTQKEADQKIEAKNRVDLAGKTLLPGFIDAHGHLFVSGIQKLGANLLPPPDGDGKSVKDIVSMLNTWQEGNAKTIQKAGWIIGFGYDDSQLAEQRHPTANELDQVSIDIPVVIIHQSSHLAVMNHKGLELAGYNADSADPAGGVIRREADGKTPNGVLEEMAFFGPIFKVLGGLDDQANERIALAGIEAYTQFGFTTAQEGRASQAAAETFRRLANEKKLTIDVAVFPDLQAEAAYMKEHGVSQTYSNHFRLAGVKLSFDGSPQGKTAWLSQPYKVPPQGQPETYVGYPAIPGAEDRQTLVDLAFEHHWQALTHVNGDAAADALITAVANAEAKYGKADRRPVMIHAQVVREDQIDKMKALGIVPSFFSMHTYYWGDWHKNEVLGEERAYHISPTQSALKRGMKFTEHHDAPVALPSAMMILHTTVNRTSRSGEVIGPDQRVSPFIALKSITEWAAWQYFEEKNKGTLTAGKLADFVILDKDPIAVEPEAIKDIAVLETIKEGQTVYKAR